MHLFVIFITVFSYFLYACFIFSFLLSVVHPSLWELRLESDYDGYVSECLVRVMR